MKAPTPYTPEELAEVRLRYAFASSTNTEARLLATLDAVTRERDYQRECARLLRDDCYRIRSALDEANGIIR